MDFMNRYLFIIMISQLIKLRYEVSQQESTWFVEGKYSLLQLLLVLLKAEKYYIWEYY